MTIPKRDRFSTKNDWQCVPLENVNYVNLNHFRLKRLIPIEHDLREYVVHLMISYLLVNERFETLRAFTDHAYIYLLSTTNC